MGVGVRIKRIVSEPENLPGVFENYKGFLMRRGYKENEIDEAFAKANERDRKSLIFGDNSRLKTDRVFPLVLEYNPKLPPINKILKENLNILEVDEKLSEIFTPESLFVSSKRSKNLKEHLAPSRFPPKKSESLSQGCFKKDKCNLCSFLKETPDIVSSKTGSVHKIRDHLDCNSKNVIYCIVDKRCNKQNVGSTTDMKKRWANYKSHIKKNASGCNLYKHWNNPVFGHQISSQIPASQKDYDACLRNEMDIILLEKIRVEKSDSMEVINNKLKKREGFWQATLGTQEPDGLNSRDEIKNYP